VTASKLFPPSLKNPHLCGRLKFDILLTMDTWEIFTCTRFDFNKMYMETLIC
jgi:hypothetical protein